MALRNATVDVFLASYNQVPGDRSGPVGRIKSIKNGVATHYDPGQGRPRRVVVKQRSGFATLPTTAHNAEFGETVTADWTSPELLSSLGRELLSIANAIPRVYDGTDWTYYAAERCISNRLSESVFHTSQRTIQAPDSAWKSGVTCSAWVETVGTEDPHTQIYVGFRGDDETWVRIPSLLYDPGVGLSDYASMARVVADAEEDLFWVVFNAAQGVDNESVFHVALFDLNGQQLDIDISVAQIWETTPGYWDIQATVGGGVTLIQPLHTEAEADDGIKWTYYTQTAGTISPASFTNAAPHCRGPLAWMTNDTGDDQAYIACIGTAEDPAGRLWGYRNPQDGNVDHEFDFSVFLPSDHVVDSLIGYALTTGTNEQSLTVSFSVLSTVAATVGPPWDPAFRYSRSYTCTFADSVVLNRQSDYTCQVSRAFLHDDQYYSFNYYQSGSGRTLGSSTISVDFTPGDYMIGELDQPVTVTEGVDFTAGSMKPFTVPGGLSVVVSSAQASFAIASPDLVELVTINPGGRGVMTLLKWTLANLTATYPDMAGSRLTVAGSSIPTANATWDIVSAAQDGSIYTLVSNTANGTLIPGTFSAAGGQTATVVAMAAYRISELGTAYGLDTATFLLGGTMVVTASGTGANDGTKTIARVVIGDFNPLDPYGYGTAIWIVRGSEVASFAGFHAELHPVFQDDWFFTRENFDDASLIGPHTMSVAAADFTLPGTAVSGPTTANNSSTGVGYPITGGPTIHSVETDTSTAVTGQYFRSPLPTVVIHVPADVTPYTFFLQDLTVDYSLIGGLLIVTGDTFQTANNAVYQIYDIDPDPSHHIVYAKPTDGRTDYRSQLFYSDQQSIQVTQGTNVAVEYQSCWLMVPLTGSKPVVGRFEYVIAYADWRFEGGDVPNLYPLHVSSPVRDLASWLTVLPYRAISFTVGQTVVTASGQVVNAAISSNASTVGTKQFRLDDEPGTASVASGEMLLPGPMCGEFTASGFHEQGVNFGFEAPFLVSQQTASAGVGLRVGGAYQIVVVAEVTDEDGDRVFSIPSPPLNFKLTGDNNSATYGGRMLQPLDSDGTATSASYGITNYKLLGISIYRTAYQDDVPTTERHKITLDLNVNGRAPVSSTNGSGFTLSEFTWQYKDENLDAAILPAEVVYTDKGYLPRFPAPAQRGGVFWKNRSWVVGYDGAIWMSGEKKEGDATWFFPLFRYVLPTTDKPVSLAEMDDYLEIQCERSLWYIPSATFPDSTGRGGTLPAPIQLPFTNGGTGHAVTLRSGVAYSSTAGGVWMITRAHENVWLSQPIQDALGEQTITSMTVDKHQRLHVTTGTGYIYVYDQVVQEWYRWTVPTSDAHFLTTLEGEAVFQQQTPFVWLATPLDYFDNLGGSPVGIALDIEIASLQFGNVRNLKAVWEMQLIGTYKGVHHLNAVLSYPDDDPDNPTVFPDPADGPYTPDPDAPYLIAINPMIEQASSYGLRVFADFDNISPKGDSFELEVVSCEVGVDSGSGLDKMVNSRRIEGK